jgi:hypothetical protein
MKVTVSRWCVLVGLTCGAFAVTVLPIATADQPREWDGAPATIDRLATERERGLALLARMMAAARELRARRAIERWREAVPAMDTAALHIDASVPALAREPIARSIDAAWQRLGATASGARAAVFVLTDSAPGIPSRAARSDRAPIEVLHLLPDDAPGSRCVAIVRLRSADVAPVVEAAAQGTLLGPCGFYAAFGRPGPAIREWLVGSQFALARVSDWRTPRAPAVPNAQDVYELPATAAGCLARGGAGCDAAIGVGSLGAAAGPAGVVDALPHGSAMRGVVFGGPRFGDRLGAEEQWFLADLARMLGAERFGELWRSADAVPAAIARATGRSSAGVVRGWLERRHPLRPEPASVAASAPVWIGGLVIVSVLAAGWPRERVLGIVRG